MNLKSELTKEIVLCSVEYGLRVHSARPSTSLQMHQNSLDHVRVSGVVGEFSSSQIGPGSYYQGRQPGEEILGCKQNMGGAITARVLEFVADFAAIALRYRL